MAIAVVCPSCHQTSRTNRATIEPKSRFRCTHCGALSVAFVHGNGAVELRPPLDEPEPSPTLGGEPICGLPPRVGDAGGERRVIAKKANTRAQGGYRPFERSQSWLGQAVVLSFIAIGCFSAYWYCTQIKSLDATTVTPGEARGASWHYHDEAARRGSRSGRRRPSRRPRRCSRQDSGRIIPIARSVLVPPGGFSYRRDRSAAVPAAAAALPGRGLR